MPSTRTARPSQTVPPYPLPLSLQDLSKDFDDAHEFLKAVDEPLKHDVDFLDHVLRTTRQIEDVLANQRQVADNVFHRLKKHGFEQKTRGLIQRLRQQRVHPPPSPNPIPKVVRFLSPHPRKSRLARKTISTTALPSPLGSRHNPIIVDDDEDTSKFIGAAEKDNLLQHSI